MSYLPIPDDVLARLARAQRVSAGELDALKLALRQRKSKDIAKQLGISEAAARKRLGEVYKKFGIKGRGPGKLFSLEKQLREQQLALTAAEQRARPQSAQASHATLQTLEDSSTEDSSTSQNNTAPVPSSSIVSAQPDSGLPDSPALDTQYCWNDAPALTLFQGRLEPLSELKHWVLQPASAPKLMAVCGMGGIGKTSLVVRLAEELDGYFERVVWLTARPYQRPDELLRSLLEILSTTSTSRTAPALQQALSLEKSPSKSIKSTAERSSDECLNNSSGQTLQRLISQLITALSQQLCLVIIDGFETVFSSSESAMSGAGNPPTFHASRHRQASLYRENLEGYGDLLQAFKRGLNGQQKNASCLVLTSREKPKELLDVPANSESSCLYTLDGLKVHEAARLFTLFGLRGEAADFKALLERCQGHPMALRLSLNAIADMFSDSVRDFLAQDISVFDELRSMLKEQFGRLSLLEIEVMYWLAVNHAPCTLEALQSDIVAQDHKTNLLYTLRSLERRFLIEVKPFNRPAYQLHPIVSEYTLSLFVRKMFEDLIEGDLSFFNSYALMKADAEESCRTFQKETIVQPILDRLRNHLKSLFQVDAWLSQKLENFREHNPYRLGYAGGNFVNLMVALSQGKLARKDFSELTIWQAYLQGAELRDVSFNHCELDRSVFTETLSDVIAIADSHGHEPPMLACGDTNGGVHIWRTDGLTATANQKCAEWSAHNGWVRSLSFIPNRGYLLTGGDDSQLKLWQLPTDVRRGRATLSTRPAVTQAQLLWAKNTLGWVRAIAVSPKGDWVASGSENKITLNWIESGQEICHLWHHPPLSSAATDKRNDDCNGIGQATGQKTSQVTGQAAAYAKGLSLALSPDNQWLASCGGDNIIRLWSVEQIMADQSPTDRSPTDLSLAGLSLADLAPVAELYGHTDWVRSLQFSLDSKVLVSGGDDKTIRIWSAETFACRKILRHAGANVRGITLSSYLGETLLASGSDDCQVRVWSLDTYQLLKTIKTHGSRIGSVAFQSPALQSRCDKLLLAAGGDKQALMLWQVKRIDSRVHLRPVRTYRGYTNGIRAIGFLGVQHIISGGDSRELAVWDRASGEHRANLSLHQGRIWAIALDTQNARIASASDDHTIRLWDAHTGQCLTTFTEHTNWVRTVSFSRSGRLLASGGDDGTLRLWNTTSGFCVKVLAHSHHWIHSVAFHPANSRYLISGGDAGIVRYWHRKQGYSEPMAQHDHRVCSVAFSPDAAWVASGSDDGTVILWDVAGKKICDRFIEPDLGIKSVAFSPNGRYLAAGGEDQIVYLWDLQDPDKTCFQLRSQSFVGLAGGIRSIAFSPDGSSLISGALDATIRIADLTRLEQARLDPSQIDLSQIDPSQIDSSQTVPTLKPLIKPERPYEKIKIEGIRGLSQWQVSSLLSLGAVNRKKPLFL